MPASVVLWDQLSTAQQRNIAAALEYFMFSFYRRVSCDQRFEGDEAVRSEFKLEGKVCDLVLRTGNRFVLAEAKGESDLGKAVRQFENTIPAIVARYAGAVFGNLAVFIRQGDIFRELPLNSTEGLAKHLVVDDLTRTEQLRFSSRHSAKRNKQNRHVLLEPDGTTCLPMPAAFDADTWGVSRLNPPEVRIFVTRFREPAVA
jgi:hypothetical protein